jgi:hypothetical protein
LAIKYTLKFGDKQIWDSKQILAKLLSRLYQLIRNWWAGFTLQTKLMALIHPDGVAADECGYLLGGQ